jgi:energy-coupling factor transporter ATP-binding protein EcfA2
MTSLIEGARQLVSKGSDVGKRIDALETAARAGRGRLDDELLDRADEVTDRAASRLRLSAQHTVVGLAGATGSGKSSTFNALTGLELSAVGVRRPTTSWATACVWGTEGATELLEWLGIPPRHQVTRDSMLDTRRETNAMEGVVLLDLPDHDSTDVSHHLEVDRLIELVDVLVWVLDPQKYADAAIHDRYLRPLNSHAGIMVVVLNHIDTVAEDRRESMVADVRRLLAADGLPDVPVYPVSARQGTGMDRLRDEIAKRVASKKSMRTRIEADVVQVGTALAEESGTDKPGSLDKHASAELEDAFADAAGVPTVVKAIEDSTRIRANRATGWPVTSWVSKLKPDPLKRLHLDLGREGKQLTGRARTSVPEPTKVQRARVDAAVRDVSDRVGQGLGRPWQESIRRAATSGLPDLNDQLDSAVGEVDLGVAKLPWWAGVVRVLQWALIVSAVVGGLWLTAIAASAWLQLPELPTPSVGAVPLPTLLLLGGVLLGILLALVCRLLVRLTAKARARSADRRLRAAIRERAQALVLDPISEELRAYESVRESLQVVLK